MRRPLAVITSVVLLIAGAAFAALVAHAANTSSGQKTDRSPSAQQFVGYWMGIDPLDGGDSRRAITPNDDRTFSVIGRDTVFTLCDGTDRAIVTLSDAAVVGSRLVSDNLLIRCSNDGSAVRLKVRYDVIGRNIVRETVTSQAGEPVDEIIFHRVSGR
jgi:hypothetical protein